MLSAIALGVVLQSPPAAFAKFEARHRDMRTLVAEFTLAESPGPVGVAACTLVINGKPNQRLVTRWGDIEYVFVQSAKGLLEFERSQKTYREYPPLETWYDPPSGLARMPVVAYPLMFIRGRLEAFAPPGTAWKTTAPDTYAAEFMTDSGAQRVEFGVKPDGTLTSFSRRRETPAGTLTTTMKFSRVVVNGPTPNADFRLNPPVGFRAEALPREPLPLSYGEAFPLKGWVGINGKPATLGGRARMLVVLAAPDCEPSKGLLQFIEKSAARLDTGNLTWIVATDGKPIAGLAARWSRVKRQSGLVTDLFRAPGTPLMYLVEPNGKLVQVWQGYHPSMRATLEKELRAAIQRKSS